MEKLEKPSTEITKAGTRAIVEDMERRGLILEIKVTRFECSECEPEEKQEQSHISRTCWRVTKW